LTKWARRRKVEQKAPQEKRSASRSPISTVISADPSWERGEEGIARKICFEGYSLGFFGDRGGQGKVEKKGGKERKGKAWYHPAYSFFLTLYA